MYTLKRSFLKFGYKGILHLQDIFPNKRGQEAVTSSWVRIKNMRPFRKGKIDLNVMKFGLPDRDPVSDWKLTDVELKAVICGISAPMGWSGGTFV